MASEKRPSSLYMDLKELRNHFDEVDTEGYGYIDYDGLKRMISHMDGFDASALQELMNTLDRDGDGKVTFEDFQIVFTLERDALKAEQRQDSESFDISTSTCNSSSSAYVTALHSPAWDGSSYSSPVRRPPPLPAQTGSYSGSNRHHHYAGHRKPITHLNQVLDSPDLSAHVRRLQRSLSVDQDTSQRLSNGSDHGIDPLVLEDTGTAGTTLPTPSVIPTSPNALLGLELIEEELYSICRNDTVEREDILKLCNRLGVDGKDEQEFLALWDELQAVSSDSITVDVMYQSIKQRETIALVTSTPANQLNPLRPAWHKPLSMESFDGPKTNPDILQDTSITDDMEDSIEEDKGETSDEEEDWVDGRNFPFHEMPHSGGFVRPSSAREGSRLSKGQSDSSLRQTAMMQNFYTEYKSINHKLEQVTQERDSLKQSLARVESEKKRLIQEGEESILTIQRQNEVALRKLKTEFSSKRKNLEASLSFDFQTQQDSLEVEIAQLKEKIEAVKLENEASKEDLRYYQSDNEKLMEHLDQLHNEIGQKDHKISVLQDRLGIPLESMSESDLELHTSRIHELESNLQEYVEINENLQKQKTEMQDRIDELMIQCEKMNQKYMEEKRKRQRRASTSDVIQPSSSSKHHKSRHGRPSRSSRQLPHGLLAPIPDYTPSNRVMDSDSQEMIDGNTDSLSTEPWMSSGEDESNDASNEADDIAAQSSTSLLEEIRVIDGKQNLMSKLSEFQQLNEGVTSLKAQAQEREAIIEKQNKEVLKLTEYTMEQKLRLEDLQDSNGKLQHIIEQQTGHINLIMNERASLEKQCQHFEAKGESQERELRRTRNESRLAIHDLAKKEEEFNTQLEKVTKLERELLWLHNTKDQQADHIAQLETHLDGTEARVRLLIEENSELETKLISAMEQSVQMQNNTLGSHSSDEDKVLPAVVTSPTVFSPDESFASSTGGQTDILHQMKSELEQLQLVLIEKEGQEGSELELSFVHELLQINTSLEENLIQQHQRYDSLVSCKDERIKELENTLDAKTDVINNSTAEPIQVQSLQESLVALRAREAEREGLIANLREELEKVKLDAEFHNNIAQKQKEEIEKLNHYLGKARFKQILSETETERLGRHIEQQKQEIVNQSIQLKEFGNISKSAPDLNSKPPSDERELLILKESLVSAEQMISEMHEQLLALYHHVIKPSDLRATDHLEYTELVEHIKEMFDSLNDELVNVKEMQEGLHESLLNHSHEYDSLYSEHEEEVRALEQQKENLVLHITQSEKKFEDELIAQKNEFQSEQEKVKKEKETLQQSLTKTKKEIQTLKLSLSQATEGREEIDSALEEANARIVELINCKGHLIHLIQTISTHTLTSLALIS